MRAEPLQVRCLGVRDLVQDGHRVFAREWPAAGEHLVQDHGKGPQVGGPGGGLAADALWRQVRGRADEDTGAGERHVVPVPRQAEVEELDSAARERAGARHLRDATQDHDVAGLEVTVDDPLRVNGVEPVGDLFQHRRGERGR
jgi:hypothetical protein